MNDEALRIHSFIANSKVFQQKFTLSQAACADTNPKGTLFKECCCLFMCSKKAFRSYLMIFKCKDLDLVCPVQVKLWAYQQENWEPSDPFVIYRCEKH